MPTKPTAIPLAGTLALVVVLLAWPACASAAIHTGHVRFLEPRTQPSIGAPGPPADQATEYEHEVLVRYDAAAGTITLEVEAWDPAYWGETLLGRTVETFRGPEVVEARPFTFGIGPSCDATPLEGSVAATPKDTPAPSSGEGEPEGGGVTGEVTLSGHAGTVRSTGSFDGQRFTVSFTDPAFRDRDWRCVDLGEHLTFKLGEWPRPRR